MARATGKPLARARRRQQASRPHSCPAGQSSGRNITSGHCQFFRRRRADALPFPATGSRSRTSLFLSLRSYDAAMAILEFQTGIAPCPLDSRIGDHSGPARTLDIKRIAPQLQLSPNAVDQHSCGDSRGPHIVRRSAPRGPCFGMEDRTRPRAASRGRGRIQKSSSCDGRPGVRQDIRIPAPKCGTARRRVFPRRLMRRPRRVSRHLARQPFGTRRAARRPIPGHDRDRSRSRATRRATTWSPPKRRTPRPAARLSRAGVAPAYCCAIAAEAHGAPDGALLTTPDRPARPRHFEGGNVIAVKNTSPSLRPHQKTFSSPLAAAGPEADFAPRHCRIAAMSDSPAPPLQLARTRSYRRRRVRHF